jgi:restriction endonuclease Mrr
VGAGGGGGGEDAIDIAYVYAKRVAGGTRIVLIDGEELAWLMIGRNVGVVLETTYEIEHIDSGYFEEE